MLPHKLKHPSRPLSLAAYFSCKKPQCPLWVISRHSAMSTACPLYPRKRTFAAAVGMSGLCQSRPSAVRTACLSWITQYEACVESSAVDTAHQHPCVRYAAKPDRLSSLFFWISSTGDNRPEPRQRLASEPTVDRNNCISDALSSGSCLQAPYTGTSYREHPSRTRHRQFCFLRLI
jgi:hypothetical protein